MGNFSKLINKNRTKYTTVPTNITYDKRLSLKGLGMLVKLLSLPNNWVFTEQGLVTLFVKEKRDSIRTALKELEDLGYLCRKRNRKEDGTLGNIDYIVFDEPHKEVQILEPRSENPTLVKTAPESENLTMVLS
jgi:hypothetical protein